MLKESKKKFCIHSLIQVNEVYSGLRPILNPGFIVSVQ